MKIAIIGFGLEGRAAYDYWRDKGSITICDIRDDIVTPEGVQTQTGENYLAGLSRFDTIVRSPVVKPSDLLAIGGESIKKRITTNTNEFFRVCPSKHIIGVSGTKGKGTTSTLISKILEESGKKVHLGGNIGLPALDLLKSDIKEDDWVVLELSSFQLIDCQYSPSIAICLMVVPEHLDWHPEIDEYFNAKTQMFRHQASDEVAIYFADNDNSRRIASTSKGWKIPYFKEPGAYVKNNHIYIAGKSICQIQELGLRGRHNWQNICAAVTACWQVTQDVSAIAKALVNFHGLEHRLEYVATVNDVEYYDDSFGTTPETSAVAIEAFSEPKVVIVGGSDKGASYDELAKSVKENNVHSVVLIGEQGTRIGEALTRAGFNGTVLGGPNMTSIVEAAKTAAQSGDVVILSPACASFDMFDNYKDRGDQFKQAVLKLAEADQ